MIPQRRLHAEALGVERKAHVPLSLRGLAVAYIDGVVPWAVARRLACFGALRQALRSTGISDDCTPAALMRHPQARAAARDRGRFVRLIEVRHGSCDERPDDEISTGPLAARIVVCLISEAALSGVRDNTGDNMHPVRHVR
jgi:hypothetical protein